MSQRFHSLLLAIVCLATACGRNNGQPQNTEAPSPAASSTGASAAPTPASSPSPQTRDVSPSTSATASSSNPQANANVTGLCALLPPSEIEAILGVRVGAPLAAASGNTRTCSYPSAIEEDGTAVTIAVETNSERRVVAPTRSAASDFLSDFGESDGIERLQGLGDDATLSPLGEVKVRRGTTTIAIDLRMHADPAAKGTAIAQKLLPRL